MKNADPRFHVEHARAPQPAARLPKRHGFAACPAATRCRSAPAPESARLFLRARQSEFACACACRTRRRGRSGRARCRSIRAGKQIDEPVDAGRMIAGRFALDQLANQRDDVFLFLPRIAKERIHGCYNNQTACQSMDIQAIREILPHRYPLLLVDRIEELEAERIVGIKNVTVNEPFFDGHFPDFPVMPGVLIVEAMAQVAGVLVLSQIPDRKKKLVLLASHRRGEIPQAGAARRSASHRNESRQAQGHASRRCSARPPWTARWWRKRPCSASSPTGTDGVRRDADSSDRDRRPRRSHRGIRRNRPVFDHRRGCRHRRAHAPHGACLHGRPLEIGEDNVFFPYSTVGVAPQDLKYNGERVRNAHRPSQPDPRVRHHSSRHGRRRHAHLRSATIIC